MKRNVSWNSGCVTGKQITRGSTRVHNMYVHRVKQNKTRILKDLRFGLPIFSPSTYLWVPISLKLSNVSIFKITYFAYLLLIFWSFFDGLMNLDFPFFRLFTSNTLADTQLQIYRFLRPRPQTLAGF
jgi:hypothetical protein